MQRKIQLFDELFDEICKTGKKIRDGHWTDRGLSVEEAREACREGADFIDRAEASEADKARKARIKAKQGEWFCIVIFRRMIHHMELLEAMEGLDYTVEMDILETLAAHLGNGAYYDKSKAASLMEWAGNLYWSAKRDDRIYKPEPDEGMLLLIAAMKDLKKEGIRFRMEQGEPEFVEDSENVLVSKLDALIKQAGGMFVVKELFEREIGKRYHADLGRYLICRNKTTYYGDKKPQSRIPYQYLIQLALKHLGERPLCSEACKRQIYDKIIGLSKAYLEVLQLQGYSVYEDLFDPLEEFPIRLSKNLCFEKMYIPRQYHPEYIKMLLHHMLEPFYPQGRNKPRVYSFFNYARTAEYILEKAMGPRVFTKDELRDELRISEYKLCAILQDISIEAGEVNRNFLHYVDETNTWRRPLVKLDANRYFCLDGRMSGYAFYEVMYQILYTALAPGFSKKQGPVLEEMVYRIFREKHFPFVKGRYKQTGDLKERDCDMILEGRDRVMFLEIKKCPLPGTYEQGDDVKVLKALGDGMLYAQEQILWHKLRLKEVGILELYDSDGNHLQDYTPGEKPVMAVSICMPEYDFLTDRNITEAFLESTLLVSYHAVDPAREKLLEGLNERAQTIQTIAGRLFDGNPFHVKDVFFNSQFRSLQQIWTMLRFCPTVEAFQDMCHEQLLMLTGAGDVYVEILNVLRLGREHRKTF